MTRASARPVILAPVSFCHCGGADSDDDKINNILMLWTTATMIMIINVFQTSAIRFVKLELFSSNTLTYFIVLKFTLLLVQEKLFLFLVLSFCIFLTFYLPIFPPLSLFLFFFYLLFFLSIFYFVSSPSLVHSFFFFFSVSLFICFFRVVSRSLFHSLSFSSPLLSDIHCTFLLSFYR